MGLSEIVIYVIVVIFGSGGLPLGVPPAPEDPTMANVAPEDCWLYASWCGVEKTNPDNNPTEKWLSQPKTSLVIPKLRRAFRLSLKDHLGENDNPVLNHMNQLLLEVLDNATKNATVVFLNSPKLPVDENANQKNVEKVDFETAETLNYAGGMLVSLRGDEDQANQHFRDWYSAVKKLDGEALKLSPFRALEIDGRPTIKVLDAIDDSDLYVLIEGEYFVCGLGDESVQRILKNMKSAPPKWLTDVKKRLAIDRVSSIGFVDVEQTQKLGARYTYRSWRDPWMFAQDLLDGTSKATFVSGLDKNGFVNRAEVVVDPRKESIWSLLDKKPITRDLVKELPADSTVGFATRVSKERLLEIVKSSVRNADQKKALDDSFNEFFSMTGVKLEDELVAALGDFVSFNLEMDLTNWWKTSENWVASIQIEDEMSFPSIFNQLNQGLKNWTKEQEALGYSFKEEKVGVQTIYSLHHKRSWKRFSWAVVDQRWYIGQHSDPIRRHLQDLPLPSSYATAPRQQELFEFGKRNGFGAPVSMGHFDLPQVLSALKQFEFILSSDDNISRGFEFKISDIPSIDELVNGVQPIVFAAYKTDQGFQFLHRQTYPGTSPPVAVGAVAGAWLMGQSDLISAKSKVRRLCEAHLAFEQKHKKFVAAYSVGDDGKPQLSWRVHLLPFLGHNELYKKFNLNEAWNSPHNKELLQQMPEVFRHPKLKVKTGETVFIVPQDEGALFGTPKLQIDGTPLGFTRSEVSDSMDETAMVFEVSSSQSVPWTKPMDATDSYAAAGLKNCLTGFCDGSARYISQGTLTKAEFKLMIDIDDGKSIKIPKRRWLR